MVQFTLYSDLEELVTRRPDSSFAPSLHNAVALGAAVRGSYLKSIQHYAQSWDRAKLFDEPAAKGMADTAAQMLGRLFAITGRNEDLEQIEKEFEANTGRPLLRSISRAAEMKRWSQANPKEAFKCGLYSLDQLSRRTEPDAAAKGELLETDSSPADW